MVNKSVMKFKKGSKAAKDYMAKIRAKKGKKTSVKKSVKGNWTLADRKQLANELGEDFYSAEDWKKLTGKTKKTAGKKVGDTLSGSNKSYFGGLKLTKKETRLGMQPKTNIGAYKKPKLFKPTKAQTKAAAKRLVKESIHKDTKSHNVNIRVISGVKPLTINQYLNQKDPQFSVLVKLKNTDVTKGAYLSYGDKKIRYVMIKKLPAYTYVQIKGDDFLYTQDNDGNPKRKSVFLLNS